MVLRVQGLRHHNLKNINVEIPLGSFTVVTGRSGSGKSSLAFDSIYAEGNRRYLETLSPYVRQFLERQTKPDFDEMTHIPAAIALEQHHHVVGSRSTVASQTDISETIKVLFARVGETTCPKCRCRVVSRGARSWAESMVRDWEGSRAVIGVETLVRGTPPPEFYQVIRERGFERLILVNKEKKSEVVLLEEAEAKKWTKISQVYLVWDRLRLQADEEFLRRFTESIQKAFDSRQGRASLFLDDGRMIELRPDFACPNCGDPFDRPTPEMFSASNARGACRACKGFGFQLNVDERKVVPETWKPLAKGAIDPLHKKSFAAAEKRFLRFCVKNGIPIDCAYEDLDAEHKKIIWDGLGEKSDLFPGGIRGFFAELMNDRQQFHLRFFIRRYQRAERCPACDGSRIDAQSLVVTIGGWNIARFMNSPLSEVSQWLQNLQFDAEQAKLARDPWEHTSRVVENLVRLGLGYMTLGRMSRTLSGGEYQRVQIATQLGHGLAGTLYVLDEPSIGLHPRDTGRLVEVIRDLTRLGNTALVVEHELDLIREADYVIEMGPGSGTHGGQVLFQGPCEQFLQDEACVTAPYLRGESVWEKFPRPDLGTVAWLELIGCRTLGLKNIHLKIPIGKVSVITGVSGSGKSSLVEKTLAPVLSQYLGEGLGSSSSEASDRQSAEGASDSEEFEGVLPVVDRVVLPEKAITGVLLVDQSPIGRSRRSHPASYTGVWDDIRNLLALEELSKRRGYSSGTFSLNVDGGRCPQCLGEGSLALDMGFLADARVPCDLCLEQRYRSAVLEVKYLGRNAKDWLETTIEEALELLGHHSGARAKLSILQKVGLGYLRLGQSAPTLSGGESQRLKIAEHLITHQRRSFRNEKTLLLFDEPSTGLHMKDLESLVPIFHSLADQGHTVVIVEHNLELVASADYMIDLGPEGGAAGGEIVVEGSPRMVAETGPGETAKFLRRLMRPQMGFPSSGFAATRV